MSVSLIEQLMVSDRFVQERVHVLVVVAGHDLGAVSVDVEDGLVLAA